VAFLTSRDGDPPSPLARPSVVARQPAFGASQNRDRRKVRVSWNPHSAFALPHEHLLYSTYDAQVEADLCDPVTAALALLAHRDEARHLAFGTEHMRYVFECEPEKRLSLTAAVERRSQMLASISGLSPTSTTR
jgi:hypothetical protein